MKNFSKAAALVVSTALIATGCSTILNDDTQKINVATSTGSSISGTVNGAPFTAPGVVSVKREKADKVFVTSAAGCAEQTVAAKKVDSTFFVNIFGPGVFGSTTDHSTGKMWGYDETVTINCK